MLKPGDPVTVLTSKHADVSPGAAGVVESVVVAGYAVKLTQRFGRTREERAKDETRTIYFPADAVELATEANPT